MPPFQVKRLSVQNTNVVVIGGGAAGLFCAIEAGKRGRKVVVLEHAERTGKKIAISGAGLCNFTLSAVCPCPCLLLLPPAVCPLRFRAYAGETRR